MTDQPLSLLETTVTLEIAAEGISSEQFAARIVTLQSVIGVKEAHIQRRSNAALFPTNHWATVTVIIQGKRKAQLRRLYNTVTNHILHSGLRLTGRGCVLTDLYD